MLIKSGYQVAQLDVDPSEAFKIVINILSKNISGQTFHAFTNPATLAGNTPSLIAGGPTAFAQYRLVKDGGRIQTNGYVPSPGVPQRQERATHT